MRDKFCGNDYVSLWELLNTRQLHEKFGEVLKNYGDTTDLKKLVENVICIVKLEDIGGNVIKTGKVQKGSKLNLKYNSNPREWEKFFRIFEYFIPLFNSFPIYQRIEISGGFLHVQIIGPPLKINNNIHKEKSPARNKLYFRRTNRKFLLNYLSPENLTNLCGEIFGKKNRNNCQKFRIFAVLINKAIKRHSKYPFSKTLEKYFTQYKKTEPIEEIDSISFKTKKIDSKLIIRWIHPAIKTVFAPKEFFGKKNFRLLMKRVSRFIKMDRHENLTMEQIAKGIKIKDISWLKAESKSKDECLSRNTFFKNFIFWFFERYLIPLLTSFFYVTDIEGTKNKTHYFQHKEWEKLTNEFINSIRFNTIFSPMMPEICSLPKKDRSNFLERKNLLRFLPKKLDSKEFRIISKVPDKSVKVIDLDLLEVLKFECERDTSFFGSLIQGDLSRNLQNCIVSLLSTDQDEIRKIPLSFATIDIRHFYDDISHERLFSSLLKIVSKREYFVYTCYFIKKIGEKHFRKTKRICSSYPLETREIAQYFSNEKVEALEVSKKFYTQSDVLLNLEKAIFANTIETSKERIFHRVKGVPQGSTLGGFMADIYLGLAEKELLKSFQRDGNLFTEFEFVRKRFNFVICRKADDILLIAKENVKFEKLFSNLIEMIRVSGLQINEEKTQIINSKLVGDITWCGLSIKHLLLDKIVFLRENSEIEMGNNRKRRIDNCNENIKKLRN